MNSTSILFKETKTSWKTLWKNKTFKVHFALTFIIFAVIIHYCTLFMSIWQARHGTLILDPLLQYLHPINFSVAIFCLVYSAMLFSVFFNLSNPKQLLKAFQAYSILLLLRTITIYFIPLEPPLGMIYLSDPITGLFLNNVNVVTKDLFFSGHISTMCLFIYFAPNKYLKNYLKICTPILAMFILWQHVHYTFDIIAAPFFAYFCCKVVENINEHWEHGINNIDYQFQYNIEN